MSNPRRLPGQGGPDEWDRLCRFLNAQSFVVLTHNPGNDVGSQYEAWAYQGPLDFESASAVRFGLGADPVQAMEALGGHLAEEPAPAGDSASTPAASAAQRLLLRVDQRELATILAALRFHQDENFQGTEQIADRAVADVATDGGTLIPLDRGEIERLCQKLNCEASPAGLSIAPPHKEGVGDEPLFRVVYVIDVNAANPRHAAEQVHESMTDPESMAPLFQIIDLSGAAVTVDLSES